MKEHKKTIENKEEISIEDLRLEVSNLKDAAIKKKNVGIPEKTGGGIYDEHFDIINPDPLPDKDLRMYEKIVKEKKITHEEYSDYRGKLEEEVSREEDKDRIESRKNFIAYLGNKATPLLFEE